MAKLNQIIAIEKGTKSRTYADISELHKLLQKPPLFDGFIKDYEPINAEGKQLPAERKRVQHDVKTVLTTVENLSCEYFRVAARKDWTNCIAKADVVVDGNVLIAGVPVTYLLFLEKQLNDIRTLASVLPTLDESEDWNFDENSGQYKSKEVKTHRTEKLQRPIVLYDATPEHPAQTQLITEDILAGYWRLIKFSGAMPKPKKERLIANVDKLLIATKEAREAANGNDEVDVPEVGETVFDFLLEGVTIGA